MWFLQQTPAPICARALSLALFAGFIFSNARAAVPTLDHLFPAAVQVGTTNAVVAIGKFDPWPPKVWVDASGIVFRPETNNGRFRVEVAAFATVGPHLVRAFNDQGASGPRFLIVTSEPQTTEVEPNDDFTKPQRLENLPAFINGRLEKNGDVDSFSVALQAGQTLVAALEAYTLASPVDAVLRIVDERGVQVAMNHDDGETLDPFLAWTAQSAGAYVVQVFGFAFPADSSLRFTGNAKCVYQLRLSRGPYGHHTLPLGVQGNTNSWLRVVGWNLGQDFPPASKLDGRDLLPDAPQGTLSLAGLENQVAFFVGNGPEIIECEPNDGFSETNQLVVPGAVTGCIGKEGDEDRFSFAAKKGETLRIEVKSASLGFPLDAWLKVEDNKGKELAKNDDSQNADPKLDWAAPEEGRFAAAVGSLLHRGSTNYLYRLSIQRVSPALKASVSEAAFAVKAGKTNTVKVTVRRLNGFDAKLTASVNGLPDGVTAEPQDVPEKGGDMTLQLVAAPEAKVFSGPFQVLIIETATEKEHRAVAELIGTTVNNGVPGGYTKLVIEATDQLWLTVLPAAEEKAGVGK